MGEPVFVTAIYGEAYAPFLLPHLHSIRGLYPRARGIVMWRDLPRREVGLLERGFPSWRFVEAAGGMDGDLHQRIPRKLHAWRAAAEMEPARPMAFLDCDTLVVRRLDEFFAGSWDIVYTWKDELFPVNTGVMLASTGAAAATLFGAMAQRVERIVRDPGLMETALGSSGAADQHALREIVGFCNYDRFTVKTVAGAGGGRELVFRGVPCRWLNETNCRPIGEDVCIVHYKTGWHPILLEGRAWTANRPQERCREMFEHWGRTRREADRELARSLTLAGATAARDRFTPLAESYEERGILSSEMLAVCGVCESLGVDLIVESGRARGQSTWMLARYFQGMPSRIVSIELERDADAQFAEQRLGAFPNVELRYGDSMKLLPEVLAAAPDRRIAVLLDGPKGKPAIGLLNRAFEQPGVVCGFIHDMRRGTPQRELLDASDGRLFFTDDGAYVEEFGGLDRSCLPRPGQAITIHTWRPGMKGEDAIQSYGPTLLVMLPRPGTTPGPGCASAPPPAGAVAGRGG
jgi:hypothetical protein